MFVKYKDNIVLYWFFNCISWKLGQYYQIGRNNIIRCALGVISYETI